MKIACGIDAFSSSDYLIIRGFRKDGKDYFDGVL